MGRRALGLVVLGVVLVVGLILPGVLGRSVPGTAVRPPLPGPPAVGDCVLDDPRSSPTAEDYAPAPVLLVRTAPCDSTRYGEVVYVTLDGDAFPVTTSDRISTPTPLACVPEIRAYLDAPGRSDTEVLGVAGLIGPSIWQRIDRQGWLACVVYGPRGPYARTVRGAGSDPEPWR